MDWDYEKYCDDCTSRHLASGGNSVKERLLRDDWEPDYRGTMIVQRAATLIHRKDRIIAWLLPEVLLPHFQAGHFHSRWLSHATKLWTVKNQLHTASKSIEEELATRLEKSTAKDSWRLDTDLFGPDSPYIRSGLANISAGWYPPGRSVRFQFVNRYSVLTLSGSTRSTLLRPPRY